MVREGKWAGGGTFCLEAMAAKMLTCPSLLAFSMKRRAPARLSMASWQKGRKPGMTTVAGGPVKVEGRGGGRGGCQSPPGASQLLTPSYLFQVTPYSVTVPGGVRR